MMYYLLQPVAPILFGILGGYVAYLVRHHLLCRPKTVNYFTIFLDLAAIYVFLIMLWHHKVNNASYSEILSKGFGAEEITIAFLFASYHFGSELFDKIKRPD